MKTKLFFILLILTIFINLNGQTLNSLNSVNPYSPDISFYNPAPLSMLGKTHASLGMQLLHLGLEGDNLRNNFVAVSQPLGQNTAVGLRALYFTSDIFSRGNYSVLLSRTLVKDIVSVGINANWVNYSYNSDRFFLFDFNDPLLIEGSSRSAVSFGAGIFLQPVPGFLIGAAADHLNSPDISLDKSGVNLDKIYNIGAALINMPVIPQIDFRKEGDQTLIQGGLRKNLLENRLSVFAGYNQFNTEGKSIFAQLEMKIGDLGIMYNFQNTMGSDFSHISGGSHQIGLFYSKSKTASNPEIILGEIVHDPHLPLLHIVGKATNEDGLTYIQLLNNSEVQDRIECNGEKIQEIDKNISLKEGRNTIEISAFGKGTRHRERIYVNFDPLPPEIVFESENNTQVDREDYTLVAQVSDLIGLEKIRVFKGEKEIGATSDFPNKKLARISVPQKLAEGENVLRIVASNKWKSSEISNRIFYKSAESPPALTIDSPQSPVSSSSTIIINLELDNYRNVDEIVIKVNGVPQDTVKIIKMRGFSINNRSTSSTSSVAVNLPNTENLVEAIVFDREKQPRTSKTMKILYNPFEEDFRYDKKTAVIVGINQYQDPNIPDLDLAVSDADTVRKLLDELYAFDEIITLYENQANFSKIRTTLNEVLYNAGRKELIVVYYAGHGNQIKNAVGEEIGYLLPSDAELKSPANNISMSYLNELANQSPARDVLFIVDACYSGLGLVERPSFIQQLPSDEIDYQSLQQSVSRLSRNMITAGGKREQAVDGLFTRILKNALRGAADINADQYITAFELGYYLKKNVSTEARQRFKREQNPQFGSIIVNRGEMVLKKR